MLKTKDYYMYSEQPATCFLEAMPIGNGRIGAMLYGDVCRETVELSESTIWSGDPYVDTTPADAASYLEATQQALVEEAPGEVVGPLLAKLIPGNMEGFGTSRPFGKLFMEFPAVPYTDYCRCLDIDTGVHTTRYTAEGTQFRREAFVSNPDGVMVMRLIADKPASVNVSLYMEPVAYHGNDLHSIAEGNCLMVTGKVYAGDMRLCGMIQVHIVGGQITADGERLHIVQADEAVVLLDMATDYRNVDCNPVAICQDRLASAACKEYAVLRDAHTADFTALSRRMTFRLDEENEDYRFWLLYARYLAISACRHDSPLPMHLQGIWNDNMAANMPWNCDFHLDINAEMNQWLLTAANLPEGNLPLARYIKEILVPAGRKEAQVQYGKPGWVTHTVTNAWGWSTLINTQWSIFSTAGVWYAQSLWDQYETYQDEAFLRDVVYDIMKESAVFFLSYMTRSQEGHLVTAPSCSPEKEPISIMATCERTILYALFENIIRASEILGVDEDFREEVRQALQELPPLRISRHGQLMEFYHDRTDGHTNHRHTSHLLGLYPYSQITVEDTPELAQAAEISMIRRFTTPGWEETEFTAPNLAAFFARLKKGNEALARLDIVRDGLTSPNLFTISPAGIAGAETDIFLIDGTMGIAAALVELLAQSYNGRIYLLPALPDRFRNGKITGVTLRGGFTADIAWRDGVLVAASITAAVDVTAPVTCHGQTVSVCWKAGETKHFTYEAGMFRNAS